MEVVLLQKMSKLSKIPYSNNPITNQSNSTKYFLQTMIILHIRRGHKIYKKLKFVLYSVHYITT